MVGIVAATVVRIAFAGIAMQLLQLIGLLLAGGILLLWVCWKMWRELNGGSGRFAPPAKGIYSDIRRKIEGQAEIEAAFALPLGRASPDPLGAAAP